LEEKERNMYNKWRGKRGRTDSPALQEEGNRRRGGAKDFKVRGGSWRGKRK